MLTMTYLSTTLAHTYTPTRTHIHSHIHTYTHIYIYTHIHIHIQSDAHAQIIPALRTIGNIVSGSDKQTQAVVDSGFLGACVGLLQHPKKNIRKEACWSLSNIAAGSAGQLQALMSAPGCVQVRMFMRHTNR